MTSRETPNTPGGRLNWPRLIGLVLILVCLVWAVSPWSPAWPMSLALVALAWMACVLVMWEVTPL